MAKLSPVEWALLPVKRYAQFSGRASRAEYWWFTLATIIVGLFADLIDWSFGSEAGILGLSSTFALLIPSIAVMVRRLHDTDRTGWWALAPALPTAVIAYEAIQNKLSGLPEGAELSTLSMAAVIAMCACFLALLVFMVLRGVDGTNRYGPDPYDPYSSPSGEAALS